MTEPCSCPVDTCNDPPCPVHGFPKCEQCGADYHDFISCETAKAIAERGRISTSAKDP